MECSHNENGRSNIVVIIGSSPDAVRVKQWSRFGIDAFVAINNAWQIRDDWDFHIYPDDFPGDKCPPAVLCNQRVITSRDYVPAQNRFGGFVYAGGTMAFTAGYWALAALQPSIVAFVGCDMVYNTNQPSHFYGKGRADPLRDDVTLQNLEAKSLRLQYYALQQGACCVNLTSLANSRLRFPKVTVSDLQHIKQANHFYELYSRLAVAINGDAVMKARERERQLNYFVETGDYWRYTKQFDGKQLNVLDNLWHTSINSTNPC